MAGFLPNLDGLQKILKSDTTFKEKLEMAKMGKSRQIAEMYLPALLNAKTFNEARNIQGLVTTEAAKYGLDDLTAKINPIFDAKVDEFRETEKVVKGQGKIGSLFQTYSGYKMKNPSDPTKLVNAGTYINAWVQGQGGLDSIAAYANADELENAIKANITTEVTEAGVMGDISRPIITVRKSAKSGYGANIPETFTMYRWDDKNNILWNDLNKNDKFDEGEPLGDQNDPDVQKQIGIIKGMKKDEFQQYAKQQDIAQGWTRIADDREQFRYKVERDKKGDLEVKLTAGGAADIKGSVINSLKTTYRDTFNGLKDMIAGGSFFDGVAKKRINFTPRSTEKDLQRILEIGDIDSQLKGLQSKDPIVRDEALATLQAKMSGVGEGTLKNLLYDIGQIVERSDEDNKRNGKVSKDAVIASDYKRMANDLYFAIETQRYASLGVPLPARFWQTAPYSEVVPDAQKSVFDMGRSLYNAYISEFDDTVQQPTTPHVKVPVK